MSEIIDCTGSTTAALAAAGCERLSRRGGILNDLVCGGFATCDADKRSVLV